MRKNAEHCQKAVFDVFCIVKNIPKLHCSKFPHENLKLFFTSEVPVEHETLKSGRDVTGRDVTGRDGTTDDGRWKDRREG